jgi:hypothetical protein
MGESTDRSPRLCSLNPAGKEFSRYFEWIISVFSHFSGGFCPFLSWIGIAGLSSQGDSRLELCLCVNSLTSSQYSWDHLVIVSILMGIPRLFILDGGRQLT